DLGAKQLHPEDVRRLPGDIDFAHINDAFEAEEGAGRGGCDTMLAGAGLSDDAVLAHPLGEESLTEGVIDLVRAGMGEVFPLEEDARAACRFTQPLGLVEGR